MEKRALLISNGWIQAVVIVALYGLCFVLDALGLDVYLVPTKSGKKVNKLPRVQKLQTRFPASD